MGYVSAIKRYELSNHRKTGMKFKCVLLSERSFLKILHTVGFQVHDILEKAKLWRQ